MYWTYFWQVVKHKWFVLIEGIRIGAPLHLLILHDISKFSPSEFVPYAKNFCGPEAIRMDPQIKTDFDKAWLLHQRRNKHHWQYWVLIQDDDPKEAIEMPYRYMLEMIADWRGAGRAYGLNPGQNNDPNTQRWYCDRRHRITLHPYTRQLVELTLGVR